MTGPQFTVPGPPKPARYDNWGDFGVLARRTGRPIQVVQAALHPPLLRGVRRLVRSPAPTRHTPAVPGVRVPGMPDSVPGCVGVSDTMLAVILVIAAVAVVIATLWTGGDDQ